MLTTLVVNAKVICTDTTRNHRRSVLKTSSLLFLAILFSISIPVLAQTNTSVYSSVEEKRCRTIKVDEDEGGSYEGRCRGVAGYSLIVEEGDLRTNIKVITPGGATHSLDLWTVVSSGFSSLGPRVEWRMTRRGSKSVPTALIIRYNANEDPETPQKVTSYLAVAKITATEICVTDKIPPGARTNERARHAGDSAQSKSCLRAQN